MLVGLVRSIVRRLLQPQRFGGLPIPTKAQARVLVSLHFMDIQRALIVNSFPTIGTLCCSTSTSHNVVPPCHGLEGGERAHGVVVVIT